MADNSTLPATGESVRDIQKGGASGPKSQVVIIDRGGSGSEDLSPLDGTDITTPTAMPTGGVGIRGWLSAIWTKLNGSLAVTGTFWQGTQPVSMATNTPDVTDRSGRLVGVVSNTNLDVALSTRLKPADTLAGVTTVGAVTAITNALPTGANTIGAVTGPSAAPLALDATLTGGNQVSQQRAATLAVTATAAAAAGVTVTLPAVAGQFHYITRINIVKYAAVAVTGTAAPVVVTSTNLPGSLAWTTPTAMAIGTNYETDVEPASPIKSSVANTATTIVCPATTSVIWRVTVYYYTAP